MILAIHVATVFIIFAAKAKTGFYLSNPIDFWTMVKNREVFTWVSLGTLVVIFCGASFMHLELAQGGAAVAKMLGGVPIDPSTKDLKEKRLLNVIEEMSIASGTPMPQVFLLPQEMAINAFAAGFTPSDAAFGVTKGCLDLLNRDELQGVIGHEFSHILNGDMRLNIRLTSLLHGILCISTIGYWMIRSAGTGRRNRGAAPVILVGLGLLIIGYIGVIFGRVIKSSVSRQREYLADASAVQFTRNPQGIANALKKIGGFDLGSNIQSHFAQSVSHMFFSDAISSAFLSLFDTHPSLVDRIKRIDPSFDGKYTFMETDSGSFDSASGDSPALGFAQRVMVQTGNPEFRHLQTAGAFLSSLPSDVTNAVHEKIGAQAIVYSIFLLEDLAHVEAQLKNLSSSESEEILTEIRGWIPRVENLGEKARVPMLSLALSSLRQMSVDEINRFRSNLKKIVMFDQKITISEYTMMKSIDRNLRAAVEKISRRKIEFHYLSQIQIDCQIVLSLLAAQGTTDRSVAEEAYFAGWRKLTKAKVLFLPEKDCDVPQLHRALDRLARSSFSLREEILTAAASIIEYDQKVTVKEAEILRMIGESLDCPIPPLAS